MKINLFSYTIFDGNNNSAFQLLTTLARRYKNDYDLTMYAVKKGAEIAWGRTRRDNIEVILNHGLPMFFELTIQRYLHKSLINYPQPLTSIFFKIFKSSDIDVTQQLYPVSAIPYLFGKTNLKIYFIVDLEHHKFWVKYGKIFQFAKRFFQNELCKKTDIFLVHSKFAEKILKEVYNKPTLLLAHGFYPEHFQNVDTSRSRQLKRNLGLEGKKVIIWTGKVEPEEKRGFSLLYRAVSQIENNYPETRLLVLGGERKFNEEWIINIPRVPYEKIPLFLSIADLMALPKYDNIVTRWSMHVVKMVEAMAAGLTVITPPIGFADTLPSDTFYSIKPGSSEAVKESIMNLFEDKKLAKKIGEAGKKYAYENLTWNHIADKFHIFLSSI